MPSHGHSPLSVDYSKDSLHAVELDETGLAMERDLGKAELARRFDLHPRDVRFLDSSSRNLPSILTRRQVILVNLPGFKAIVSADSVVIFDSFLPHVQGVLPYLRAGLNPHADPSTGEYQGYSSVSLGGTARMPYEFIALEYILMTVTRNLEERFEAYVHQLVNVLGDVDKNIGEGATLMHLLQLKNGLTSFEVVLRETATAIKEVLQSDEDMAEMYLTDKKANRSRETSHHEEMEVLLETYLRKVDELENEVSTHLKSITLTENHIQIRLDTIRNAMMRVELLIALGTFGVATGALGASFFGMNIRSGFETLPEPYTFWATAGVFSLLAFGAVRAGVRYCAGRKIDLFHVDHEPRLSLPLFSKKKRYIAPPSGGSFSSAMPLSCGDSKPPPPPPLPGKQKAKPATPADEENKSL